MSVGGNHRADQQEPWAKRVATLTIGTLYLWIAPIAAADPSIAWQLLQSLFRQILWIGLPLILFAVIFHVIEGVVQRRLVERFGWKAALWTGWIGTPIHESSHALGCWVFGHQIDAMALFEPDSREGRLGYVRHSYQRGDWWQEAGNFFIGLAPLAGGTLALLLVTSLMYPDLVQHFWQASQAIGSANSETGDPAEMPLTATGKLTLWGLVQSTGYAFGQLVAWDNVMTFRFWLFLYLSLCITSHMAPSASDYHGAWKGALLLLAAWLIINLLHGLLGLPVEAWGRMLTPLWQLVFAMLMLSVTLGLIVSSITFLFTVLWDQVLRQFYR